MLPDAPFGSMPVLLPLPDGRIAVIVDTQTMVIIATDWQSNETVAMSWAQGEPWSDTTVGGVGRVSGDGEWLVRLSDPLSFQNPRAIATLRWKDGHAEWTGIEFLKGNQFPMSGIRKFTAPDGSRAPIVGDVFVRGGKRFAVAEGSDAMSVNKYGSDFFTLAEVDGGGTVVRRLYEESGWTKQPGKHGIRARFTSDGSAAILRPVFKTSDWKGRSQLVDLHDAKMTAIPSIRGAADFALVDVQSDTALLVSRNEVMFAHVDRL